MTLASISTKTQTISGHCFGKKGEGRDFQELCRTGHRRRTHTERPILSGVYTTQCTSHYRPLSHNDRYLLASHSRSIPLIWTLCYVDERLTSSDYYRVRFATDQLTATETQTTTLWLFIKYAFKLFLSEVTRHIKTPPLDNFLWRTPLRFYAVFLSLLRNYKVLLDTRYN